ncbi:hypothetical protein T479_17910 [Lysinibacillus varians]|nr:hypothetical protein T479_17910 [Lysinibacillus varians]
MDIAMLVAYPQKASRFLFLAISNHKRGEIAQDAII